MQNYIIKINLTDGDKEVESVVHYEHYLLKKELRGINLLDEVVEKLMNELNAKKDPYISDNFQIGPDGAYEADDNIEDWDNTLSDGLNDEN